MNFEDFSIDDFINSIGLKSAQEAGYIKDTNNFGLGIMAASLSSLKGIIINFLNSNSTLKETIEEIKLTSKTTYETYLNYIAKKGLDVAAIALKTYLPGCCSPIIDVIKVSVTQPLIEKINKGLSIVFESLAEKLLS